jgi:tetratricopeptide (TPR) repeat protein
MLKFVAILLFSLFCGRCLSQSALLADAMNAYERGSYAAAVVQLEKLIPVTRGDTLLNVQLKLADCYAKLHEPENAFTLYKKIPFHKLNDSARFQLADYYARFNNIDSAVAVLKTIKHPWAENKIQSFLNRDAFLRDSLDWKVYFTSLNTGYSEFAPVLYGKKLIFSSNRPSTSLVNMGSGNAGYVRVWEVNDTIKLRFSSSLSMKAPVTKTKSPVKQIAKSFPGADNDLTTGTTAFKAQAYTKYWEKKLLTDADAFATGQTDYNVASPSISDNKRMYLTTNHVAAKGKKRLQIREVEMGKSGIENSRPLGFSDSSFSFMHPAISADGKLLVFSSDKKGGNGGFDLYYCLRFADGFSDPVKLPATINTPRNEVFPVITSNGWLYFSSDGHPGLGGLDIYRIRMDSTGVVSGNIAEHISYPVNSTADDFGWTQTPDGSHGFFSSDRLGDDNIYAFHYTSPNIALYGSVVDSSIDHKTQKVFITVNDHSDPKMNLSATTDDAGNFSLTLKANRSYTVIAVLGEKKIFEKVISTANAHNYRIDLNIVRYLP